MTDYDDLKYSPGAHVFQEKIKINLLLAEWAVGRNHESNAVSVYKRICHHISHVTILLSGHLCQCFCSLMGARPRRGAPCQLDVIDDRRAHVKVKPPSLLPVDGIGVDFQ